jgi:hypothetical protein
MKTDAAKEKNKEKGTKKVAVRRRDVLRTLGFGAGAAMAASAPLVEQAVADSGTNDEKRKARYQANSANVQNYYRVNRYPK